MTIDMPQSGQFRVLVIFGGRSAERAVSLESGQAVAGALRSVGHTVGTWDPAATPMSDLHSADWDIAFPMLHGTGGEDGVLHRQLCAVGLPWVGCSIASSALTFDKSLTRARMQRYGIQVPLGTTITGRDTSAPIQFPVVVKPARQGSSIGVSMVRRQAEWGPAVDAALVWGSEVVVESYVAGREVSIPVIDGEVFPTVEIIVRDGWYDYDNKYKSDRTRYRVAPPDLPANMNSIALMACEVCGVEGIARVDFRINETNQAYVLEINTIPGMTIRSLVPRSAAAAGLSLSELCDRCVGTCMRRHDAEASDDRAK